MIGWRDGESILHRGSLFGAFAALARGEAWSFPALRPHQISAWHAFTVQVAALALIRAGRDDLPGEEASWRELLLALADGQPEAWELVVDDWTKPALLQPPIVTSGNRADYKTRLATPDALDLLVTARNHDVKQERIAIASEEDWLFALVTLQTSEGTASGTPTNPSALSAHRQEELRDTPRACYRCSQTRCQDGGRVHMHVGPVADAAPRRHADARRDEDTCARDDA